MLLVKGNMHAWIDERKHLPLQQLTPHDHALSSTHITLRKLGIKSKHCGHCYREWQKFFQVAVPRHCNNYLSSIEFVYI